MRGAERVGKGFDAIRSGTLLSQFRSSGGGELSSLGSPPAPQPRFFAGCGDWSEI